MRAGAPIVVVGYGSVGRRHVTNLLRLTSLPVIVVRSGKGKIEGPTSDRVSVVPDVESALGLEPRAAVIATPTSCHIVPSRVLTNAGCALFVEKPLASDREFEAADDLVRAVEKRELVSQIGCQFRFHPLLSELRSALAEGGIGEVLGASAEWGEYLPDWHPWEDHRSSYAARADMGGGALLTLVHPIDYVYWLLGPARRVQCAIRNVSAIETAVADDWVEVILEHESGAISRVHLDYVQRPRVHRLTIWGTKGRADLDFDEGHLQWRTTEGNVKTEIVPPGFERNDMFIAEMTHFLTRVEEGRATDVPLAEGLEVLRIVGLAREAATLARGARWSKRC